MDDHASSRRKRRSQLEGGSSGGKATQPSISTKARRDGRGARQLKAKAAAQPGSQRLTRKRVWAHTHTHGGGAAAAAAAKPRSKNGGTAGQAARSVGHSRSEPASHTRRQIVQVPVHPLQLSRLSRLRTAQHRSARVSPTKGTPPVLVDCHSSCFARLAPRASAPDPLPLAARAPLPFLLSTARGSAARRDRKGEGRRHSQSAPTPFRVALSGSAWLGLLELCPNDSVAAATALHPLSCRTQSQSRFA